VYYTERIFTIRGVHRLPQVEQNNNYANKKYSQLKYCSSQLVVTSELNVEGSGRDQFYYYPGICVQKLRKTTRSLRRAKIRTKIPFSLYSETRFRS
jgi:hypothetical protein